MMTLKRSSSDCLCCRAFRSRSLLLAVPGADPLSDLRMWNPLATIERSHGSLNVGGYDANARPLGRFVLAPCKHDRLPRRPALFLVMVSSRTVMTATCLRGLKTRPLGALKAPIGGNNLIDKVLTLIGGQTHCRGWRILIGATTLEQFDMRTLTVVEDMPFIAFVVDCIAY